MISKDQLFDLVQDDKSIRQLLLETKEELANRFGSSFAVMKDYDQDNPHHHLDLLSHSIEVATSIVDKKIATTDFIELRIAALYHDIGKPFVAQHKDNRHVFYGHPEKSWEISKPLLTEIGLNPDSILRIGYYIAYHDAFISFKFKEELPPKPNPYLKEINLDNVLWLITSVQQKQKESNQFVPSFADFSNMMLLCVADAYGQAFRVISHGKMIDSRQNKVRRMLRIRNIIDTEIRK